MVLTTLLKKKLIPYLFLLPVLVALVCFEQDYLWAAQEHNLFLHTPLFFRQCMVTAGGLLTWVGAYLTQWFYYPALGAGVLCLLWAVLIALLTRVFRIPAAWWVVTLVPVACLLVSVTDLGYWVYYLKLRGHMFDATVGTIVAVGLTWVYTLLPARWYGRTLWVTVAGCVGYPLLGFYGLLAIALMALLGRRWADIVMAVVVGTGIPLVCYHALFHETNLVNIYWTALPVFWHQDKQYFAYNLPYVVLFGSIVLMAVCRQQKSQPALPGWVLSVTRALLLTVIVAGTALSWYKDDNFHRELSMSRDMDNRDWQAMLATSQASKGEPTRAVCMMQNLALGRLGRLGEEMFSYPNGAARANAPFPVRLIHTVGKQLYLAYGVPNYCYRWCMEDGVEYGWTAERLKLMTLCSLVNGELDAAQHYVSLLKKTTFHRQWARHYQEYIHNPRLVADDPELGVVLHLRRQDNFLTADQSQMEQFLLEHFTTAESADPLLQEQILVSAMQAKNMQLFWRQFYQYTELHRGERVPRHYQEAACLFGHLMNIDVSHMPFDPQVVSDYQQFAGTVGELQRQGRSLEQIRPTAYGRFRHTYYYDFYFNRYNYVEN